MLLSSKALGVVVITLALGNVALAQDPRLESAMRELDKKVKTDDELSAATGKHLVDCAGFMQVLGFMGGSPAENVYRWCSDQLSYHSILTQTSVETIRSGMTSVIYTTTTLPSCSDSILTPESPRPMNVITMSHFKRDVGAAATSSLTTSVTTIPATLTDFTTLITPPAPPGSTPTHAPVLIKRKKLPDPFGMYWNAKDAEKACKCIPSTVYTPYSTVITMKGKATVYIVSLQTTTFCRNVGGPEPTVNID